MYVYIYIYTHTYVYGNGGGGALSQKVLMAGIWRPIVITASEQ